MVVMGVDLRASPKRPSAVVALDGIPQFSFIDNFSDESELLELARTWQPEVIAIGAPLGLPAGFCCLETSCSCDFSFPHSKGRQSEIELSRMGISCFFTNKGSIIRGLIYRAIDLSRQLRELGFKVVEVYPHGSKVILFGDNIPPKNSRASLKFMREHLPQFVEGLNPHLDGLDRNACDAVLNAYIGVLHTQCGTDALGVPEEGFVVLPKLPR